VTRVRQDSQRSPGLPKEPRTPKGAQDSRKSPSLHVMATHESGLLALLWASQSDPDPTTHSPEWALLPASSARSVFGTRQGRPVRSAPVAPPPHPPPAPACQRAAPRAVTTSDRPMRQCRFTRSIRPPVPHSGVAPRRARKCYPAFRHPVKGWAQGYWGLCRSPAATRRKNGLRSPARRSPPHRPASGTPSLYYDNATMSSSVSWSAIRAPARLTAMGPREQDNKCN
jgi:hypothetical protein